jgi:hypothetical protein
MASSSVFVLRDDGKYDLVETNHRTDEVTILETLTEAEMNNYHSLPIEDTIMFARGNRDDRLRDTDWWASSDLTMTDDQIAYRQALRDIPTHTNWPNLNDEDWPTKPE